MKRLVLGLVLSVLLFGNSYGQKGYDYKFTMHNLPDTTVLLSQYFGNRLIYKDTAVSENGVLHYKGESSLDPGMYCLVLPGPIYYNIFVEEPKIEMEADFKNPIPSTKVIKSKQNKILYDYISFLGGLRMKAEQIRKQKDAEKDPEKKKQLTEELQSFDQKVKDYQNMIINDYPDDLASKILRINFAIEIPDDIKKDSLKPYLYMKEHYFDYIDFTDDRIVHCLSFHQKVDDYFKKMNLQIPDSIIAAADVVTDQLVKGSDVFKYIVHYITHSYETSEYMGMDAVFVHMAQKYYCPTNYKKYLKTWENKEKVKKLEKLIEAQKSLEKNKSLNNVYRIAEEFEYQKQDAKMTYSDLISKINSDHEALMEYIPYLENGKYPESFGDYDAFWMDMDKAMDVCDKATKQAPLLMGKKAPRIILPDTTEVKWIDLYEVKGEYTVLYFWRPDCGHCKTETPKMQLLYDELKAKGVEVYAVNTNLENKEWRKFIIDNNLNWINVSDNPEVNKNALKYIRGGNTTLESLNFRTTYDIFSTPQVYVLDKDKVIIAKKLDTEGLKKFFEKKFDKK